LFKTALQKYGHIDYAAANAGVINKGSGLSQRMGWGVVEKELSTAVLDINLKGVMYFARIACAYLAHGRDPNAPTDKSLTFLS
jgi:NAD(P)-dependent dehydrogenase (short-subunit alcohol dehydrogenase family)